MAQYLQPGTMCNVHPTQLLHMIFKTSSDNIVMCHLLLILCLVVYTVVHAGTQYYTILKLKVIWKSKFHAKGLTKFVVKADMKYKNSTSLWWYCRFYNFINWFSLFYLIGYIESWKLRGESFGLFEWKRWAIGHHKRWKIESNIIAANGWTVRLLRCLNS